MQRSALRVITLRRELAARYARVSRLWITARNAYHRLHERPVPNLSALRIAAARLEELTRGRAALQRDLKALSD